MNTESHKTVRSLCEGALMIAMAEILSFLPLYRLPWGGSIDLSMLPIFIFCTRWGLGPGLLVSAAHAVLQMLGGGAVAQCGACLYIDRHGREIHLSADPHT